MVGGDLLYEQSSIQAGIRLILKHKRRICPGSNWGPSACKADVITTTPQIHVYNLLVSGVSATKMYFQNCKRTESRYIRWATQHSPIHRCDPTTT